MHREDALRRLGVRRRAAPETIVRAYRALSGPLKRQLLQATSAEDKQASKKELSRIVRARDVALGERLIEMLGKTPTERMKLKRARKFFGLGRGATNKDVEDAYALCMRVLQRRFAKSDDDEEMAAIRRASETLETIRDLAHKEQPPPPEVQETPAPAAAEGEPSEYFLAPFRARIVAFALDYGIVYLLARAVGSPNPVTFFVALFVVYHAGLQWYMQRTLGKALMGLRVIRAGHRPITLAWALGRSTIGYFVVDLFGLGLLTSWFDRKWRRCAHDFVFGSVVVSEGLQRAGLKVLTMRLVDAARSFEEAHAAKMKRVAEVAKPVTDYVESLAHDERVQAVRTVQSMWGRLIQVAVFLALLLDKIVTLLYGADQKLTIAAGAGGAAAGVLGAGGGAAAGASGLAALGAAVPAGMSVIPVALTTATTGAIVSGAAAIVPEIRDAARAFASPTVSIRSESTFDRGREGWRVGGVSSGTDPVFRESDGNPGGFISFSETSKTKQAARALDLVLVIDGSGSMSETVRKIRDKAQSIVKALKGSVDSLRVGLVCFRNTKMAEAEDEAAREFLKASDLREVGDKFDLARFDKTVSIIGGTYAGWEEDQYLGVLEAVRMSWREGNHVSRAVVVITDAGAKDPDDAGNTLSSVTARLYGVKARLYVIVVKTENQTTPVYEDAARHAQEFTGAVGGEDFSGVKDARVVPVLLSTLKRAADPRDPWYWNAPPKFLRDLRDAYGRTLTFDLKHERPPQPGEEAVSYKLINAPDIVLRGGGTTLVRQLPYPVPSRADYWTAYSIPLHETGGWRVVGRTEPPSAADVHAVLSLVRELKIRADFVEGVEQNSLDNVFIREPE
ncbi:MAG: VWA domain-containing protein [Planctomycetota bacterium]|nr:VWA domain-containing protein [Planctomycetota bacterium]